MVQFGKNYHFVDLKRLSKWFKVNKFRGNEQPTHTRTHLFYFKSVRIHFEFLRILISIEMVPSQFSKERMKIEKKLLRIFFSIHSWCSMHFNGNGPSVSNYWQHDLHSILNAIYRYQNQYRKYFYLMRFFSAQWAVQIVFYMQIWSVCCCL